MVQSPDIWQGGGGGVKLVKCSINVTESVQDPSCRLVGPIMITAMNNRFLILASLGVRIIGKTRRARRHISNAVDTFQSPHASISPTLLVVLILSQKTSGSMNHETSHYWIVFSLFCISKGSKGILGLICLFFGSPPKFWQSAKFHQVCRERLMHLSLLHRSTRREKKIYFFFFKK